MASPPSVARGVAVIIVMLGVLAIDAGCTLGNWRECRAKHAALYCAGLLGP